ncbi:MAG: periplasmic heavy metal sensor, partial [Gracilimonas sp.]
MTYEQKYRWAIAGLIIMILLNAISLISIWNQTPQNTEIWEPGSEIRERDPAHQFMKNKLNLDEAKADSITDLRRQHFREVRVLRRELEDLRRSYFNALTDDPDGNSATLDSMVQEMGRKSADIELSMHRHMVELNSMLNQEQRREFGRMM